MSYHEAKEHARCRLHDIFAAPYSAFGNAALERRLHLDIAIEALIAEPLARGPLRLQVLHGWENGNFVPETLQYSEHLIGEPGDIRQVAARYQQAMANGELLPCEDASLLARPLDEAIARARQQGQAIDRDILDHPARWPAFERGLTLYTFFKVYHRLTYGEDDNYRSILCQTTYGPCEIHEFHLEECEFAVSLPREAHSREATLLIVHMSQLEPLVALLSEHLS